MGGRPCTANGFHQAVCQWAVRMRVYRKQIRLIVCPMDQFDVPVHGFDNSGIPFFQPRSAIGIGNCANIFAGRNMGVAADDAFNVTVPCFSAQGVFIVVQNVKRDLSVIR